MNTFRALLFGAYGYIHYTKTGFERRLGQRTMSDESLKNANTMNNKVCIVTGANSGLGYQTSLDLAKRGCTLHLLCRSEERGKEAVQNIINESNNDRIYLHVVDMSSLKSIRQFLTSQIGNFIPKLNILINNAGAIVETTDPITQQPQLIINENGYENNFLTNTLGPYYLTRELINFMEETAKTDNIPSRVITVVSGGMFTNRLDLNNLQNEKLNGTQAYAHCKRQMSCITEEWAKNHDKKVITFNSCHPGWSESPGVVKSLPSFYEKMKGSLRTLEQGADTQIYLAVSDEVTDKTGLLYEDRNPVSPHFTLSFTQESEQERLELIQKCDYIVEDILKK